jgi:tRNA pseudouridine38-40 synthase
MRIALGLEYDGAPYCGWQHQPGGCGIQDHPGRFADARGGGGAGRTDAGVRERPGGALHRSATRSRVGSGPNVLERRASVGEGSGTFAAVPARGLSLPPARRGRGAGLTRPRGCHRPLDVDAMVRVGAGRATSALSRCECGRNRRGPSAAAVRARPLVVFTLGQRLPAPHGEERGGQPRLRGRRPPAAGVDRRAPRWPRPRLADLRSDGLYLAAIEYDRRSACRLPAEPLVAE